MQLVLLFLAKFSDKFLSLTKTILLIKSKILLSAIVDSMGFLVFIFITKRIVEVSYWYEYLILASAVFCAGVSSNKIISKFEKDKEWLHIIQISNRQDAKQVFDAVRENGLQIITQNSYNNELDQTLSATIKTCNKEQAKILKELLANKDFQEITLTNISSVL